MPLDDLLTEIRACRACAGEFSHAPSPVIMVAEGVRVLICGQAPGARAHGSGLPFDDASGERLRQWLGLERAQFYGDPRIGVAAMAFCFPGTHPRGGDRPPPERCARLWRPRLLAALPDVALTLLVGWHAQRWALGPEAAPTMTRTVANWRRYLPERLVLPHPSWRNTAWLRRNPWFEAEAAPEFRARVAQALR